MRISSWTLKAGSLSDMKLITSELPAPEAGEVQVEVRAIGLNFADIFAIWGLYSAAPENAFVPGLEYAGVITKTGAGVDHLSVGQRIMGVTRFGAYTTGLNIDARYVVPVPTGWSLEQGASYLVQTLTAYYGLVHLGNLKEGSTVLIHSAVGGVGLQALQICKAYQAFTIGTVGQQSKVQFGLEKGYNRVIVRGNDFESQLNRALEGKPLELVMDSVGGRYFSIPFSILAPMGRLVVFGSARYASVGNRPDYLKMLYHWLTRPKIDPQQLPESNKAVLGFNLIWLYERASLMHQILKEVAELDLEPPHVGHTFPMEEMHRALLAFQSGKTIGKVVVLPGKD